MTYSYYSLSQVLIQKNEDHNKHHSVALKMFYIALIQISLGSKSMIMCNGITFLKDFFKTPEQSTECARLCAEHLPYLLSQVITALKLGTVIFTIPLLTLLHPTSKLSNLRTLSCALPSTRTFSSQIFT